MLVFGAQDAAFAPVALGAKPQLPFEDLCLIAGRLPGETARQLTGIGGRVKADGKRKLIVIPLASGDADGLASVQVLEVGEGAAQFVEQVRSCFPTLVKKNPLAYAPSDSEDEDSDVSDSEEAAVPRKKRKASAQAAVDPTEAKNAKAVAEFMSKTRVKVLPSIDEFFKAFDVDEATEVAATINRDASIDPQSQLLCVDFPADLGEIDASYKGLSFGVLFVHSAPRGRAQFLQIPLPRSLQSDGEAVEEPSSYQDATVLSFGTHRESTVHGGGKNSDEMVKNIRMRHASGTFVSLVLPTTTWTDVQAKYQASLPPVQQLHGELRLRRFVGPSANAPVELLLES